ncbi:MAG: hypothetical protein A2589_01090 [Candidatus Vogelbacteria bacterium RIFOXYD1_FULL_46_19]|uniref:Uncharacterized protein n=1 Tax=Candidatus Vogelbacteria bacterium RIFOXYD1_FULL_46_19 TaxID=1802439 RepID=A0A1G2QFR1_9BACT|nr:MAG: hypothetical protein A2589_01090 [Candidatus Vogelbacteria bacterium RIFOXYD1_FULL_46_19]
MDNSSAGIPIESKGRRSKFIFGLVFLLLLILIVIVIGIVNSYRKNSATTESVSQPWTYEETNEVLQSMQQKPEGDPAGLSENEVQDILEAMSKKPAEAN